MVLILNTEEVIQESQAAITAVECEITRFMVINSGSDEVEYPLIQIWWVKRDDSGETIEETSAVLSASSLAALVPDSELSMAANIKAMLYTALINAGIFPAGIVT